MLARLRPPSFSPLEGLEAPARTGRLYAIVDAARDLTDTDGDCLPPNTNAVRLLPRAGDDPAGFPWLVALSPSHVAWLCRREPDDPRESLALSDCPLESLSHALGPLLAAVDPSGQEVVLRYFDPRILARLLATMDAYELQRWFCRVEAYGIMVAAGC